MTSTIQSTVEINDWKVTSAMQMKIVKLLEMKILIGRIRPFTTKTQKNLCRICPKDKKTMQMFQNEILLMKAMHKNLQKGGMILSCPKYRKMMKGMKIWVLEVEDIIWDLILIQTTQKTSDTRKRLISVQEGTLLSFLLFLFIFKVLPPSASTSPSTSPPTASTLLPSSSFVSWSPWMIQRPVTLLAIEPLHGVWPFRQRKL